MASTSNTKFNEANLAVLKGLIANGTIDNMTTAAVQNQWSQFFGHIKKSTFSSRLSRLRSELGKSRSKKGSNKKKCTFYINMINRILTWVPQ